MDADITMQDDSIQIIAVKRERKRRGKYFIYAEHQEEAIMSVSEDILIRYNLLKGQHVTADRLSEIIRADNRQSAYELALVYLGNKARARKEVERYLLRKAVEQDDIQAALDRLEKERIIEDGEYAKRFAQQSMRSRGKGSLAIRQDLMQRGISKQQAAEAVMELDQEAEMEAAIRAACRKWPYIKGETRQRTQKLAMFLMRRGYPGEIVRKAVNIAIKSEDLDEDGLMLDN
ncbi:RecX family transcriptional regulator [Paenibacillaceae bacterium]|nr:RecX family transcriptional regulator [Paenibacillaceae bacterium]